MSDIQLDNQEKRPSSNAHPKVQFISIRLLLFLFLVVIKIRLSENLDRLPPRRRPMPDIRVLQTLPVVNVFARFIVILVGPRFSAFWNWGTRRRCRIPAVVLIHLPTFALCSWRFCRLGGLLGGLRWFGVLVWHKFIFIIFYLDGHFDYRVDTTYDLLCGCLGCRAF